MIDLDELERLAKAATPGLWDNVGVATIRRKKPDEFIAECAPIVVRSVKKFHKCMNNADYIVAACNATPELIKRVHELERQRAELAELAIYNNGCFDCPLEDVCLYKEEQVRDSEVCSRLLIEWVEKTAKEAGE